MAEQVISENSAARGSSITLDHVSKDYGRGEPAVKDMVLKIEAGEFFSLLGSSGSGKTTTLKMLSGLEFPTAGRVYLGETDITDLPANKRDVHTVFQNYALFPHLSVFDNVAYGLKGRRIDRAEIERRVAEMLDLVEMTQLRSARPDDLSGGQQQRVALARALVLRPQALLLDEPLGALDMKLRHHMQDVIRDIHKEIGTTFVYVTHDQEEAFSMSDRVAVMDHGELKQVSDPVDLYEHPANLFVAKFVGSANIIRGRLSAVRRDGLYEVMFPTLGTMICPGVKGLRSGMPVHAVLRPQDIWLGSLEGDGVYTLRGTVVDRLFSGAFARLTVEASGLTLNCLLTGNGNTGAGLTEVNMSWKASDMWIVRDDE